MTSTIAPAVPGSVDDKGPGPVGPPRGAKFLKMLPLAPSIALMVVFLAGPILYCLYAAFTNMALTGTGAAEVKFIGFDNFRKAFGSSAFINSIWLTLVFTLISAIIGQNTLGLGLALLMRRSTKLVRSLVGTAVIGAWVLPEIVAAYLLSAFLNSEGTLNVILERVGLNGQDWMYGAPIIAVSIANIWRGTAFSMLVYSAALSEIPKEIEESAEMDGAAGGRRLWWVTLPMISRAILTNLMLITLQTLSVFGLIYAMTRGGPGTKSQTLPLYMYEQAFSFSQIGYGTAIALVMLAIGAVFSLIYLRGLNSEAA
ncbi:sugar ABC transporter permease [Kribbella sp. NBC_01245]|uniref:carbohydrate ABC transporter permease n=1 Tax=Kribbella sp. NBC_01245 TaxID=2903578 RepID=UPI002E2C2CFA|nr:sugar ABC transporter permease [Kribbella sp. NBC_01245]